MKDIPYLIYNFAIIAGTTYLIVELDWSMWTYLLAMLFLVVRSTTETKSERTERPPAP